MNDELRTRLIAEIDKSGFSLEVSCAREMRRLKWLAVPNLHYQDVAGGLHEIDIYGMYLNTASAGWPFGGVGLDLVVECKRSRGKPWVFFEDKAEIVFYKDVLQKLRVLSELRTSQGWSVTVFGTETDLVRHHYAGRAPRVRTYFEAFKDNRVDNEIFSAIRSVWYAEDWARRWFESRPETEPDRKRSFLLHGVIVLDGELAVARLGPRAEWRVASANHVMLRTVDAITKPTTSLLTEDNEVIIDVVRASHFRRYLRTCEADVRAFSAHLEHLVSGGYVDKTG